MKATLITTDGRETATNLDVNDIAKLIHADCCDTVNLRDGRTLWCNDEGHLLRLPVNLKATKLYWAVCKPGTTHQIRGDVVITHRELA